MAALGNPFINVGLYFAESEVWGKGYFFFPRRCMDCFEQADSCWLFYISQLLHHLPFQRVEFKSCIMYVTSASFCFFKCKPSIQPRSETDLQNMRRGGSGGFQSHIDENMLGLRTCSFGRMIMFIQFRNK